MPSYASLINDSVTARDWYMMISMIDHRQEMVVLRSSSYTLVLCVAHENVVMINERLSYEM